MNKQNFSKYDVDQKNKDSVIKYAVEILANRLAEKPMFEGKKEFFLPSVNLINYLRLQMACLEHEIFFVVYLDHNNSFIKGEQLFRGSDSVAAIYPREVAKNAIKYDAKSVIFSHNHPSGSNEASGADVAINKKLKEALKVIKVDVVDHIIIAHGKFVSMLDSGQL